MASCIWKRSKEQRHSWCGHSTSALPWNCCHGIISRKGGKKAGGNQAYQKVKFDRQIVAVARVHGAHTIYSDDQDLGRFAKNAGLKVVCTWDLPIPPSKAPLFDDLPDEKAPKADRHGPKK